MDWTLSAQLEFYHKVVLKGIGGWNVVNLLFEKYKNIYTTFLKYDEKSYTDLVFKTKKILH